MNTPLKKATFGLPQLLFSEDSDDESDEEQVDPMKMLDASEPRVHSMTASLPTTLPIYNTLVDVPESEVDSPLANGLHSDTSATNILVNLPSAENSHIQHGNITLLALQLTSNTTTQDMQSNAVVSSQSTEPSASLVNMESMSGYFASETSAQGSDSASRTSRNGAAPSSS